MPSTADYVNFYSESKNWLNGTECPGHQLLTTEFNYFLKDFTAASMQ